MLRSSMWRRPHFWRTRICSSGSGEISSAKARKMNMVPLALGSGLRGAGFARLPEDVPADGIVVETGEDKEEVREAVKVNDHLRIDRLVAREGNDVALGPTADGAV